MTVGSSAVIRRAIGSDSGFFTGSARCSGLPSRSSNLWSRRTRRQRRRAAQATPKSNSTPTCFITTDFEQESASRPRFKPRATRCSAGQRQRSNRRWNLPACPRPDWNWSHPLLQAIDPHLARNPCQPVRAGRHCQCPRVRRDVVRRMGFVLRRAAGTLRTDAQTRRKPCLWARTAMGRLRLLRGRRQRLRQAEPVSL